MINHNPGLVGVQGPSSARGCADDGLCASPGAVGLGNTAKTVVFRGSAVRRRADVLPKQGASDENPEGRRDRRRRRYALQHVAGKLLPGERVAACMCGCGRGGVEVVINSAGVAGYRGLQTCGSVWVCPVCSARVSGVRRAELNSLLGWGRGMGYSPVMMTLTLSHHARMSLHDVLEALKDAKRKLHQSKAWRAISGRVVGHVTATEVTYGANGWHPHLHMLLLVTGGVDDAVGLLAGLRGTWIKILGRMGYYANDHALQVQGAAAAGDYVAKWGAAEELSLSTTKGGSSPSNGGLHPFQLLERAAGDLYGVDAGLFIEYAQEFKGRRQLVWSLGLKRAVGIVEVADAEIVAESADADDPGSVVFAVVAAGAWRKLCDMKLRAQLLTAVEMGTGYQFLSDVFGIQRAGVWSALG